MSRRASLFVLAIALVVGAAMRAMRITSIPLSLDEAYSYMFAQLGWMELWSEIGRIDHNPPLYYSFLKVWSGAFGWDEIPMRMLSVLASLATIPVVYALGRSLGKGGRSFFIAAGAAAIIAVHPETVNNAVSARSYAFVALATALSLLFAVRLMRGNDRSAGTWIGLLLSLSLLSWMHNLATTLVLWIVIALLLWALSMGEQRARAIRRTLLVGAGVAVLWLPALAFVLQDAYGLKGTGYWIRAVTSGRVLAAYTEDLGPALGSDVLWLGLILAASLAGAVLLARRSRARFEAILLGGALVVPTAIQIAVSASVVPLLTSRTLAWMVVPMAVLVAAACAGLPTVRVRAVAILGVAAVFLAGTVGQDSPKDDWRSAVAAIAEQASPDDLVVLTPGHFEVPFAYYAEREDLTLPLVVLPGVIPGTPPHTGPLRQMGCAGPDRNTMDLNAPDCPIAGWEGDVWLIALGRPRREPAISIRDAVADGRSRVYHQRWGLRLRVSRYSRR